MSTSEKLETRDSKSETGFAFGGLIANAPAAASKSFEIRRFFRHLRLPLRVTSDVEQAAARNRVERLFEVNFRSSWIR